MQFTREKGKIIFNDEYWKGGNKDNFKAPFSNNPTKDYEYATSKFKYVCGKISQNVIMVDYDNTNAFECRLKIAKALKQHCIAIKSPNKGGHFYWFNQQQLPIKNNSGNKTLLTFSPVDYKCGIRKIESTGEIKQATCAGSISNPDGTLREMVYCSIINDGTLDEIPFYDLPLNSGDKFDFLNMKSGDGRQDGLFTYMNPVKAAGYSYEEFKKIAELIEQFIFIQPLGDEFENAIRQEAWDSIAACDNSCFYGKSGQFIHNKFADYLQEKYHIAKVNGCIHIYKNGVYVPGYDAIENVMIDEIPTLTRTKRNEVLDYLRIRCEDAEMGDMNLIAFKNGIYNINTNELEPFNPQHIITNKIPWNYNPNAKSELVDNVLDRLSCDDVDIRYLLEEVAGACLYRDNTLGSGKAVILFGEKGNGKSTYINMIQAMLGYENTSNLDFNELDGRFNTVMLYGKLANLGDDISDKYKDDVSLFKKIVTGEVIKAEEKGKPPFNFRPYCTPIFSANSIPKMNDPTGAVLRRLLIVPLNASFKESDPDHDAQIRHKLQQLDCMEYFIQLALDGLCEVLKNGKYTIPVKVQQEKEAYEKENNPILAFITDGGEDTIQNEPTSEVYKRYELFCADNGFKAMSNLTFSKRINQLLGTETGFMKDKNRKTIRIFKEKATTR